VTRLGARRPREPRARARRSPARPPAPGWIPAAARRGQPARLERDSTFVKIYESLGAEAHRRIPPGSGDILGPRSTDLRFIDERYPAAPAGWPPAGSTWLYDQPGGGVEVAWHRWAVAQRHRPRVLFVANRSSRHITSCICPWDALMIGVTRVERTAIPSPPPAPRPMVFGLDRGPCRSSRSRGFARLGAVARVAAGERPRDSSPESVGDRLFQKGQEGARSNPSRERYPPAAFSRAGGFVSLAAAAWHRRRSFRSP